MTKTFNIIGWRYLWLGFSGLLVLSAVLGIAAFGWRQSIDFSGGTLWRFQIGEAANLDELQRVFTNDLGWPDLHLTLAAAQQTILARLPVLDEAKHQAAVRTLKAKWPAFQELSFESIGPSIGAELRRNALFAIVAVLVGISLYIAFAFRKVARPVSSWKYGLVTLLTLFHDVLIPAGLLTYLGRLQAVEIDSNFVVALLVVAGFSVHDTIVVFDRIRENLTRERGKMDFGGVVNHSINQTLARSVNTSLTLILVLLAILLVGPVTLRYFIITLLLGTTIGTYSSIFVASPLLYLWQRWSLIRS